MYSGFFELSTIISIQPATIIMQTLNFFDNSVQ
jgi:hypothetical protein